MLTEGRRAAYQAAYELLETRHGQKHAVAAGSGTPTPVAARQAWHEVASLLTPAPMVTMPTVGVPLIPAEWGATLSALVHHAEELAEPALLAVVLGLRALAEAPPSGTAAVLADAGRAVALLDDEAQPPPDRCTGYVLAAAAFDTLQLWELADDLYGRASWLTPSSATPAVATALTVNRALTRLEWALALLENGEDAHAQLRLAQAAAAFPAALAQCLTASCRRDIDACVTTVDLLRGQAPTSLRLHLAEKRRALATGGDSEVLLLLDAATALAHWRHEEQPAAIIAAGRIAPSPPAFWATRSFPLWVRVQVLDGHMSSPTGRPRHSRAHLLNRALWDSRRTVLAAARARIASERHRNSKAG